MWNLKTRITEKHTHPTVMPPYQTVIVKRLIASDYFLTTGELQKLLIDELGENAPTRASIVTFTSDLFDNGYALKEKAFGRGGIHAKYNMTMTIEEFKIKLVIELGGTLSNILAQIFN